MEKTCDLHIHTNKSDGILTPLEVIKYAKEKNLKNLSITDHDNVDFYFDKEASNFAKENGIEIIPGCEFVCNVDGVAIEILGYGIDIKRAKEYLNINGVNQNMLERLRDKYVPPIFESKGIKLDYDSSSVNFSLSNPQCLELIFEAVKKSSKAREIILNEDPSALDNINNFLRKVINNQKSYFFSNISSHYPSYKKIINTIHSLGGIAILAHPLQYGDDKYKVINSVINAGIDGIECYHFTTFFAPFGCEKLKQICKDNGLLITGGSDFHYPVDPAHVKDKLNEIGVPISCFNNLKKSIEKAHNDKSLLKNFNI